MNRKPFLIVALVVLWFSYTNKKQKKESIFYSAIFSLLECFWYRFWYGQFWTSWQQFVLCSLFFPIVLFLFSSFSSSLLLQLLLVPIWIWLFEFVAGHFLLFVYNGENPAWSYSDKNFCKGTIQINIKTYFRWLGLGMIWILFDYFNFM